MLSSIRPNRLRKGDLIGIITPASPVADASRIDKGVRYLESLGYRTIVGDNVGKAHGYLAGTDEERAADIHAMFSNRNVKAIICVRGGYGTPRLLSLLDYKRIAQNPKIFVGYSDATALQLAFWKKCRLITFHGPMAGVEMANQIDPFTEEMFWHCVTSTKKIGNLDLPAEPRVEAYGSGKATGRLLGGNLSLIVALFGTRYQPDYRDAILFIEEITEEPYRIDRMMMQIHNARLFTKANGLMFGQFTDCNPVDPTKPSLSTDDVLRSAVAAFGKTSLINLPFGHISKKMTLPVGIKARLDARNRTLEFLEPAVR